MLEQLMLVRKILDISRSCSYRHSLQSETANSRDIIINDLRKTLCRVGYPARQQPSYDELIKRWRPVYPMIKSDHRSFPNGPDVCVELQVIHLLVCVEIGCIHDLEDAQRRLDRLLNICWRLRVPLYPNSLLCILFVNLYQSPEEMFEEEQRIERWIAANYGRFKGVKRINIPNKPEFAYSFNHAILDRKWARYKLNERVRWPRYVSFCIWC